MKTIILAETVARELKDGNNLFSRGGMTVRTARSGEEMLLLHRTGKADLLIMDCALPGMDMLTLCEVIRDDADLREVSILLVRGDSLADEVIGENAEVNQVLTRPFDTAVFFATVSRMLKIEHRAAVRVPMRLSYSGKDGKDSFVGLSCDLSASGMLLHSGRILQYGEQVECTFAVGSRVVTIDCRVVRTQPNPEGGFLYGVTFMNPDAGTRTAIEQFLRDSA